MGDTKDGKAIRLYRSSLSPDGQMEEVKQKATLQKAFQHGVAALEMDLTDLQACGA